MGRSRFLLLLAGVIVAALCLPAAALAGTYSWNQPANFTTTPPGANPDHDSYGGRPWSYQSGPTPLPATNPQPSTFSLMSSPPSAGSPSWSAGAASIGVSSGQLVMTPSPTQLVAVGWTSPFASPQTVSVSLPTSGSCPPTMLVDQNGTTLSTTPTVSAGGTIYVVAQRAVPLTSCSTSGTLSITAVVPPPAVALTGPANGAVLSGAPTFSGQASTDFGAAPSVTVRVYAGPSAIGTPVQTLFATRSSTGSFSVTPSAALPPGQYTAQAEQDDIVGDVGASNATTFVIQSGPSGGGGLKPVKGPAKIGSRVTISKAGFVSVNVSCLAARTDACTGYLLIVTQRKLRPRAGGPMGRVRVLFAYVSVPGGRTETVTRPLRRDIAVFLQRHKFLRLRFESTLRT